MPGASAHPASTARYPMTRMAPATVLSDERSSPNEAAAAWSTAASLTLAALSVRELEEVDVALAGRNPG